MLGCLVALMKNAALGLHESVNRFTTFVIVPQSKAEKLLREFDLRKEQLRCTFCKADLSDLTHLRAIYRYNGDYLISCDRFECTIEARDKLIE